MAEAVCKNGHPAWYPPQAKTAEARLEIFNSLTEAKEAFVPESGRTVKMYVCGPTVYDMSHMGHARAYLSFDIIRRILVDYFHYDVVYQMNITDIDDKIILKARKNELFRRYEEMHMTDAQKVLEDGRRLMAEQKAKVDKELGELEQKVQSGKFKDEREKTEVETQLKQLQLKAEKMAEMAQEAEKEAGDVAGLLRVFKDLLSDSLDKEQGLTTEFEQKIFIDHARKYEELFFRDLKALGVRPPDLVTRVTEYVPEIAKYIEKIIANGFAYESNGSVYFDTQKFARTEKFSYPKLVPQAQTASTAELQEGEGALANVFSSEKRHPNDFALWKKSKPGEPRWASPWSEGRPGWHIECSVMASAVFGDSLDIHGGGSDLKFPHHANECAQSEAYEDKAQWVNFFMHAGHLHIKGLKMSKSLKNFITIEQALENFTARQIRIMFLLQQWERPVNFSDSSITEAKDKETRFNSFFARINNFAKAAKTEDILKPDETDKQMVERIVAAQSRVHLAMCDNFNTPEVMAALEDVVAATNQYLLTASPKTHVLLKAGHFVHKILRILGVVSEGESLGLSGGMGEGEEGKQLAAVLDQFCALRDQLRALGAETKLKQLFEISDDLRDRIFIDLGVRVEDDNKTSRWSLEDPAVLRRELEAKRQEKLNKAKGKQKK